MQRAIEHQARVGAAEAVVLGRVQRVVPGREAFQVDPALPVGGVGAVAARGLDLGRILHHLGPGPGRLLGIEAGLLEGVLVVVEDRGRAVERERQHLALGGRVVAGHRGDVDLLVELLAGFLHHGGHRLDRALGAHHRGGADLEYLQDRRGAAGAEGGDAGGQRLVVVALVDRHDLVLGLAGVELAGNLVDLVVQRALHCMPPLDFDGGMGGTGGGQRGHGGSRGGELDGDGAGVGHRRLSSFIASSSLKPAECMHFL